MTNFIIAQILSVINGIFLITSIRSKEKKKFLDEKFEKRLLPKKEKKGIAKLFG